MRPFHRSLAVLGLAATGLLGCQAAMYGTLEKFGIEKRDILLDRVEDARDSQSDAKEDFASALERFRSVVAVEGGELESTYDKLNADYERAKASAAEVNERIGAVEDVAGDLFEEWQGELAEYSNAELRRDSERLLKDTRQRYAQLLQRMKRAEATMPPVLEVLQDSVLTLKHNLNAQAVRGLRTELADLERQTARLVADMERSIAEADAFMRQLRQET